MAGTRVTKLSKRLNFCILLKIVNINILVQHKKIEIEN